MIQIIRCIAIALCILIPFQAAWAEYTPTVGQKGKDIIWVPTSHEHVDVMLKLAKVTPADYVIDLGSGDGRLVIAAAKRGARALGIEYEQKLVDLSVEAAKKAGVNGKASFEKGDIFETDFSEATVLTLFLLDALNERLRPVILEKMKPGTRVVSNSFKMGTWEPDETVRSAMIHPESKKVGQFSTFLWIVPAKVDGTWKMADGQIVFDQKFQKVFGVLQANGKEAQLEGKLNGTEITFTAGGMQYTGTVAADSISGTREDGAPWKATR